MKGNQSIIRTKDAWDKKYSKMSGYTLWEWTGKGNGWKFVRMSRCPKPTLDPRLCITEADKILHRINMSLQELHDKRKAGVA